MNNTPKCSDEETRQRLQKAIAGLVVECPQGHKNPTMCPLYLVRSKRSATRSKWLESLSSEDMAFVADYHRVCLEWQEAGCP